MQYPFSGLFFAWYLSSTRYLMIPTPIKFHPSQLIQGCTTSWNGRVPGGLDFSQGCKTITRWREMSPNQHWHPTAEPTRMGRTHTPAKQPLPGTATARIFGPDFPWECHSRPSFMSYLAEQKTCYGL